MNGILLIDKPQGKTSHDIVSVVRRTLQMKRVGHAGTLDPMATGVLVVLVGKATKVSDFLLNKDKRYRAGILLGCETDSYDMDGTVINKCEPRISEEQLKQVLQQLIGQQIQIPPMFSAIKQNGKKLYEMARKGIEVERHGREITIHSLDLLSFDGVHAEVEVHCSKGTYIRSLAHDIGAVLGCGACLDSLIRCASGQFSLADAITVEQLERGEYTLIPTHSVFPYPSVTVNEEQEKRIRNGAPVLFETETYHETIKIFSEKGMFLCTAIAEKRPYGCYIKPETMFLEED
ncbi:MAG: tRNA pseudouridine(55) synthase TruB [Ruminococcaceae bacterium]|nr:tRNA pseudouridine(55) synthase TruB [Oscillospiraceae bacterium]